MYRAYPCTKLTVRDQDDLLHSYRIYCDYTSAPVSEYDTSVIELMRVILWIEPLKEYYLTISCGPFTSLNI